MRAGRNASGSQRYRCGECGRKYTPRPRINGYSASMRERAIAHFQEGASFRAIARMLQINHQTVSNWIVSYETSEANGRA